MLSTPVPTSKALIDRFGRRHTLLRVSVTDRCNLRCQYCMPACGVPWRAHDEILRFEEIAQIVRVAVACGVHRVRLTGGEPLVRRGIVELVRTLAKLPGLTELTMTTNGTLLAEHADALKSAGLRRVNISLDTIRREPYRRLTRCDVLSQALAGIDAARRAGLEPVKLNAVLIRGFSEPEIVPLARFARKQQLPLRLIEHMPTAEAANWSADRVLPADEALAVLSDEFGPLEPIGPLYDEAAATEYRWPDGGPTLGVIRSITAPFCHRCNRLRLSADGRLWNCLFSQQSWNVADSARCAPAKNDVDARLTQIFSDAVQSKCRCHGRGDPTLPPTARPMYQIGG